MKVGIVNPEVSVLLPVRNSERYLRAALESVLRQTFTNLEVIAIDDGSTDGSGEMLDRAAHVDRRVRVVHRENRGIASTLNEALGLARGEYVARMDSDDIAMPGRFAQQVAFLAGSPECLCVGGRVLLIDEAGRPARIVSPPEKHDEIDRSHMEGHTSIIHPTAMMRAEAVRKIGGYSPEIRFAQDLDLWLRLAEVGKIANIPRVVLKYRVHQDAISSRYREEQLSYMRRSCELARRRRGIPGEPRITRHWRDESDDGNLQGLLDFGWSAFVCGYRWTALVYGAKAVAARPMGGRGWKLLGCAAVKRMRGGRMATTGV